MFTSRTEVFHFLCESGDDSVGTVKPLNAGGHAGPLVTTFMGRAEYDFLVALLDLQVCNYCLWSK